MKIRWQEFERALRPLFKPHDAVQAMTFWQKVDHYLNSISLPPFWIFRAFVSIAFLTLLLFNRESLAGNLDSSMALYSIWLLASASIRTGLLLDSDQSGSEQLVRMLPISLNAAFKRFLRRIHTGAIPLFIECLAVYTLLPPRFEGTIPIVFAFACALLQTAFYYSITTLVVRFRLRPDILLMPLFVLLIFPLLLTTPQTGPLAANAMYQVNPFGWVNSLFVHGYLQHRNDALLKLIPVLLVLATAPWSFRALRRLYFNNDLRVQPRRKLGITDTNDDPAEIRTTLLSGKFLDPLQWDRHGPIEGVVGRTISPDEKRLAQAMLWKPLSWTRDFVKFLAWLTVFVLLATLIPLEELTGYLLARYTTLPGRIAIITAFFGILALCALTLLNAARPFLWRGILETSDRHREQTKHLAYRLFPLNFFQTGHLQLKINTILLSLFLPVAALFSLTWPGQLLELNPPTRLLAYKILILFWGLFAVVPTNRFTPAITEGLKYWRIFLIQLLVFILLYAVAMLFLAAPIFPYGWTAGALYLATSIRWFQHTSRRYRNSLA